LNFSLTPALSEGVAKSIARSAAFQAAGASKALIRGYLLPLQVGPVPTDASKMPALPGGLPV